jgi:predicted type IV restriction endonuclease
LSLALILNNTLSNPLKALGLHTTTFIKYLHILYLWHDVTPKITSITARINSIIFTGKHKARRIPAPKAVKTKPFGQPLL